MDRYIKHGTTPEGRKPLRDTRMLDCQSCGGDGEIGELLCSACKGMGRRDHQVEYCEACQGTGRNYYQEKPWQPARQGGGDCSACDGRGYIIMEDPV